MTTEAQSMRWRQRRSRWNTQQTCLRRNQKWIRIEFNLGNCESNGIPDGGVDRIKLDSKKKHLKFHAEWLPNESLPEPAQSLSRDLRSFIPHYATNSKLMQILFRNYVENFKLCNDMESPSKHSERRKTFLFIKHPFASNLLKRHKSTATLHAALVSLPTLKLNTHSTKQSNVTTWKLKASPKNRQKSLNADEYSWGNCHLKN